MRGIDFISMATVIPPGKIGEAEVKHWECTDGGGIHAMIRGLGTANGTYAQLYVGGRLVMSDTDMEKRSNWEAVWAARGDVLIGGLGLGMVILPILQKPEVTSVRVVEKSADVIRLVEPALRRWPARSAQTGQRYISKLQPVECGDVFQWTPPKRGRQFDYVYMDIWSDICPDDYEAHRTLRRRYGRYLRMGGRVDSWMYDQVAERR